MALPFEDVVIDVQGPFTKAEGGEQYVLSYFCTRLKVPFLEELVTLKAGHFSRALLKCVFRSRRIPSTIRSDRGPEMRNKVMTEMTALCGIKHSLGASMTPRHQGIAERGHQDMMRSLLILM